MISLQTKFEVSMLIHCKDTKGNAKYRNSSGLGIRGHPMSLATQPFDRVHMTSYSTLINKLRLSCTVFEL